jgi:hypothetical protein
VGETKSSAAVKFRDRLAQQAIALDFEGGEAQCEDAWVAPIMDWPPAFGMKIVVVCRIPTPSRGTKHV